MDFILGLAMQFWPMTVFCILVIIGLIINLFDKKIDNRVNFKYKDYPHMKPIRIATKGKVSGVDLFCGCLVQDIGK